MLLSVLASLSLSCAWEEEECSWFDDSDTYYCGYIELTSVPTDIPENTVELLLYENQISSIPPGLFSELSVCTDLELRRNNITEIGARAFEGFEIMKYNEVCEGCVFTRLCLSTGVVPALGVGVCSQWESGPGGGEYICDPAISVRVLCLFHNKSVELQLIHLWLVLLYNLSVPSYCYYWSTV